MRCHVLIILPAILLFSNAFFLIPSKKLSFFLLGFFTNKLSFKILKSLAGNIVLCTVTSARNIGIIFDSNLYCSAGASTPCKAWSKCSRKKVGGRLSAEIGGGKILLAHQTLDFSDRNALKLVYKQV
jgi:hypothetical protein